MSDTGPITLAMTIRDEIAVNAMQALIINPHTPVLTDIKIMIAKEAYAYADAMLAVKGEPPISRYGKKKK